MAQILMSVLVILGLPSRNADLLAFAKAVLTALTGNPHFPNPTPTLATFAADVAGLEQAKTATERKARRTKVVQDLRHLRDYVQSVVETLTTDVLAVVETSGFRARKRGTVNKQALAVKDGSVSGEVHLVAKAVARVATYYWQWSLDGKTWTSVPDTMKATAVVAALTPGQTYEFRFRALSRAGASDFSQTVSHVVR